jgi:hypothetical protein
VEKADREERRAEFHELGVRRYAKIAASGKTIPWSEMRRYLEDRLAGKNAKRPTARRLAGFVGKRRGAPL